MFTGIVISVLVIWILHYLYQRFTKRTISIHEQGVLITGCDTGFGHELAKRLDNLGFTVFATCLYKDGDGAKALRSDCSNRTNVIELDVSSDQSVADALKEVTRIVDRKQCGIWGVVNNAGIDSFCDIEFCPMEMYQQVMNINFFGIVRVTKAFLPMIRKSRGRVVNVTSVKGRISLPRISTYGAAKYAGENFSDVLRLEMMKFGVKVSVVEPGNFGGITAIVKDRNLKRLQKEYEAMWENASKEIKETYGKDYLFAQVEGLTKAESSSYPTMDPVLDALEDALINENPQYRYLVDGGKGLYDTYCAYARLIPYLPTSWMDILINRWFTAGLPTIKANK